MKFHSQIGQDAYLYSNYYRGKRGGTFVDVGAYDGETYSNSCFFERYLDWTGLCVEPLPKAFAKLRAARKATCLNYAVADFEGEADFLDVEMNTGEEQMLSGLKDKYDVRHLVRINKAVKSKKLIKVAVRRLDPLLEEHGIGAIDYLSVDTEGAEMAILRDHDFDRHPVMALSVENNYDDDTIRALLRGRGLRHIHTFHGYDELYCHPDLRRLAVTTVFCAVWHKDPDRHALLRGHQANLDALDVPVERIYVFDAGDRPPDWLRGRTIVAQAPLGIYEAWNLAIAAARTPFVMNLNLDDRLHRDALTVMERAMWEGAALVGGDWRNCFSQAETDAVDTCVDARTLPVSPVYPPRPGAATRLGNGTGEMKSMGHACLWRRALHHKVPRYPHRLADGSPIHVAADRIFWRQLAEAGRRLVCLPTIVGHYHSHPGGQAEFRHDHRGELARAEAIGVDPL